MKKNEYVEICKDVYLLIDRNEDRIMWDGRGKDRHPDYFVGLRDGAKICHEACKLAQKRLEKKQCAKKK